MKFKSLILTAILLLLCPFNNSLWAELTTSDQAEQVVTGWLMGNPEPLGMSLDSQVKTVETFTDENDEPIYHIVHLQRSRYVVVSADDLVEPIIAFVKDGSYDPSPENPLAALVTQDLKSRIAAVRDIAALEENGSMKNATESQKKWEQLSASALGQISAAAATGLDSISDVRVPPLVKSKWGQKNCCDDPCLACYNYYTPPSDPCDPCDYLIDSIPSSPFRYGDPNNFYCGCVPTAMAQLMRYHTHPVAGIGKDQNSINLSYPPYNEPAWTRGGDGYGGPYQWNNMPYEPNCSTTKIERQAIGALCYDAGVSIRVTYAWQETTGYLSNAVDELRNPNVFDYNNAVLSKRDPTISALYDMINPNLDYNHPVMLSVQEYNPSDSAGHAILADGYGYNNSTLYHHVNMGWEGLHDIWYNLPNVHTYDTVVQCIYNIFVTGSGEIISGRVTNGFGTPVTAAIVSAQGPGGPYNTTTNSKGIYALAHLPSASTYTISVTKAGYAFTPKVVSTGTSGDNGAVSGNRWAVNFAPISPIKPNIYVDQNATGNNSGSSWYNAYIHLQDALADPCASVIWVAQGTYRPDSNTVSPNGSGDRDASFVLIDGVLLYGGFAGFGATDPNARDFELYETILSGDLSDNDNYLSDPCDLLNEPSRSENSYHVVNGSNTGSGTVLDGFTIEAGNANAIVQWPRSNGGGLLGSYADCKINNCRFNENSAEQGGAIYNVGSNMYLSNSSFIRNYAKFNGGAIVHEISSSPIIINCIFRSNKSGVRGGALCNWSASESVYTNCLFNNNYAEIDGGAMWTSDSNMSATNCTFRGNSADEYGGALHFNSSSNGTLANNILWADTAGIDGNEISLETLSTVDVNYCDIKGGQLDIYNDGTSTLNWGSNNINADPCFVNSYGPDAIIGTQDDNLRLLLGSSCIDKGDNNSVPPDTTDLDKDGSTAELTPYDLDNNTRLVDGDANETIIVDMGAYEYYPEAIYVDYNAPGSNNGQSWKDAFNYLQDALEIAQGGDNIWVAKGRYTPDSNLTDPNGSGTRDESFILVNGVGLYGGFAGISQSDPYARDFELYETILSADLDFNDTPGIPPADLPYDVNRNENSWHVVIGSGTEPNTILDGFTISGGFANGSSPDNLGGGMYNSTGSPTVTNCKFTKNSATFGGAMANEDYSSPFLTNCNFSGNLGADGGGIYNKNYCDPTVTNCIFSGNWANNGAGMYNDSNCNLPVTNCSFTSNRAQNYGGAIHNTTNSSVILNNSILWDDTATTDGNEISLFSSSSIDANYCDIRGGQIDIYDDGTCTINWLSGNINADPCFVNPNGPDGTSGTVDDNLHLLSISPCIDAGNNNLIPADITDLDNDGNTTELTPYDLDNKSRIKDGDNNATVVVDMGAYEHIYILNIIGDFVGQDGVDFKDLAVLAETWYLEQWQTGFNSDCDISDPQDNRIDELDLKVFADNWLEGK